MFEDQRPKTKKKRKKQIFEVTNRCETERVFLNKQREKQRRKTKKGKQKRKLTCVKIFFSLVSLYHIRPHRSVKQKKKTKRPNLFRFHLRKSFYFVLNTY
jgi:hypothetical protein